MGRYHERLSQHKKAKGEYYLYKKTYLGKSDWYGGYSYVDLLVPGVTEKFIDLTMKGYEKTIKDEFGKSVFGIFTDEPTSAVPEACAGHQTCSKYSGNSGDTI